MILDKAIIFVCCCLAAAAADQVAENNKEAPRTARNVFLPPYYNNGLYYHNNPWNYNNYRNNYYNPYHHPHHYPYYNNHGNHFSRVPIAAAAAAASAVDYRSPVLYSNDVRHPDGSYFYEFETANGIRRLENSVQTLDDNVVQGSYSHVGPDGKTYTVNYVADKNGYRASGAHLPQQPQETQVAHVPLSHRPIIVTTPRPIVGNTISSNNKVVVPATAFPAFDYRHAALAYPNNVYVSPYQPFSTVRPFLANPYPLGKK